MDDETIKYNPLPEEPVKVGPKSPRAPRVGRGTEERQKVSPKPDESIKEEVAEIQQVEANEQQKTDGPIRIFNHSKTGFPGAWTEEEVSQLLNAWESIKQLQLTLDTEGQEALDICEGTLDKLRDSGFRDVKKYDVRQQMNKLRKDYRLFSDLHRRGKTLVRPSYLPQLERLCRKPRKYRRRNASSASNQVDGVSEEESPVAQNATHIIADTIDQNRNKRVRFQRQTLQRTMRTMIGQLRTILEHMQTLTTHVDESNNKGILLLEKLVEVSEARQLPCAQIKEEIALV